MNIKKLIVIAMTLIFILINFSGNFFETSVFASKNSSEIQEYKVDDIITVTQKTDVVTPNEDIQIPEVKALEEVFSKFGIPLIIVPGVIFIFCFLFILRLSQIKWAKELQMSDPINLTIVVIVGIVITIILKFILNLLIPYDTNNFLWDLIGSVIVSIIAAFGCIAVFKKRTQDRTFTTDDIAITVLEKVSKNQSHLKLDLVKIDDMVENTDELLLLLPGEGPTRFLCPKISIRPKKRTELAKTLKSIIINKNSSKKLVRFLKKYQKEFEILWSDGTDGTIPRVIEQPLDQYKIIEKENLIDL